MLDNQMKILFIAPKFSGGIGGHAARVAEKLREYGFDIKSVVLMKHPFPGAELSKKQECYRVEDPAILGRRSSLVTKSPVGIMVHAKKIKHKNIFV